jgi:Ecdysteroid kinase-like family
MTLATTIEGLSPETLTALLQQDARSEGVEVNDVAAEPVGTGQLATSYRLNVTYAGRGGPATLVAKLPSTDPSSREIGSSTGAYNREVRFYQEIAAHVTVRRPDCYHASISDDGTDFVLLLEDLTPARQVGQMAGCGPDDARQAMQQAARLHGSSWRRAEVIEHDFLPNKAVWGVLGAMVPSATESFLERFHSHFEDRHREVIRGVGGAVDDWLETLDERRCLWHGDFRLDNLLFDAQNAAASLAVLDWQSVAVAPGVIDVPYFLGTSLETEERRRHERDLVLVYHDELLRQGAQDYSFDQCWQEYRAHALYALIMLVPISMSVQKTERGDRMFGTMVRRVADQVADHGSFDALRGL